MGRGKLPLEFITKERPRRTTYEKRKNGLLKKANEFSILCGVDACVIIYGSDASNRSIEPTTWPPDHQEVRRIIDRYHREGKDQGTKKTAGLLEFFMMRKRKVDNELEKARLAGMKAKFPVSDELIANITEEQGATLLATLASRLEIAKKLLAKKKEEATQRMNCNMMVGDLYYPNYDQYLQVRGMFQEQQTPLFVKPLDVYPPHQLQYYPTSYSPPPPLPIIESEKDNEWQQFVLPNNNQQFYPSNCSASIFPSPSMDMQANNNFYHEIPCVNASTSNNSNFHENSLMDRYPSLNAPVRSDQPIQVQDNAMIMFDPSSSSMFHDTSTVLPVPTLMQHPLVRCNASKYNGCF